jgi:hypothetical protein
MPTLALHELISPATLFTTAAMASHHASDPSVGLTSGVNIKWLAEYWGTSVAMIEKHYGKYIRGDVDEQFERLLGAKTETFTETQQMATGTDEREVVENSTEEVWWRRGNSVKNRCSRYPLAWPKEPLITRPRIFELRRPDYEK